MAWLLDTVPIQTKGFRGKLIFLCDACRSYNEDRVAIILNIMQPKTKAYTGLVWPKCSFFGVYDGHGGNICADYLRDFLHQMVIIFSIIILFR